MSVQIFINGFAPKKCVVYNGNLSNTIKDLKRFLKTIYNIPTYRQNIVYSKILSDETILYGFDNCTFNLIVPVFAGPEKIFGHYDKSVVYVIINVPMYMSKNKIVSSNFFSKCIVLLSPEWFVGGRGGVIDRIIEYYPELDGLNLQLMLGNKRLNTNNRIGDYPDITGNYVCFNRLTTAKLHKKSKLFNEIVSQIGIEKTIELTKLPVADDPYYGYHMNFKGKTNVDFFYLTLSLYNSNDPEYSFNFVIDKCAVCNVDYNTNDTFPMRCKHRICSNCLPFYNQCGLCK